ncbi:alpha/beta fold hydrolase [Gordonia sp. NPDC127522]|uniref:alpha/beta fold hydrolase n=1 Tax=Gordonia sp. NPDC127522 TaxID=3345390 RepID=UPI00362E1298
MLNLDFDAVVTAANADGEFPRVARYWTCLLRLSFGRETVTFRLDDGHISVGPADAELGPDDVLITAPAQEWTKLLAAVPEAGWHDLYKAHGFTVDADFLVFGPYYAAIRRLVDLMRDQLHGIPADTTPQRVNRKFDDTVGRYLYLDVDGVQYRVYYEQTGTGIPLLLQHTAGADGRQWRHILENRDYQDKFQMIAVDLPFHGKSLPPVGRAWWTEDYKLTRDFLLQFYDAFVEALELDRPAFMGCSVGGMLAPDLAYYRPGKYRAVIALNGALAMPTEHLASPDRVRSWFHPRVSNEWKSSSMLGVMAPTSPEAYRRETAWTYSQGAPPVFTGDIYYYMQDHDLTAEQAAEIDTEKTSVYLLTGEYDALAITGGSKRLAEAIDGVHFEVNPGAGHFGPSENPVAFTQTLDPVLTEIAKA